MKSLPESWVCTTLDSVAQIQMGQSPDSITYNQNKIGLPFFQGKAEFGKLNPTVRKWCSEPKKIAEYGDILLSIRAPVGPSNIATEKCAIGRGLASLRSRAPINQNYLFHFIRQLEPWLSEQGTGSTFAAVSGDFVRAIQIPLAPLNEQKRIADKLDTLLAAVDACSERLDKVPTLIKRFRQSVLAAATSGALTEEQSDGTFRKINVGALLLDIRYGTAKKCLYEPRETPVIRIPNICDGLVSHADLKYAKFDDGERKKLSLISGDILIIRSNGSVDLVGRTALVTKADEGFLFAGYLIRLRVNHQIVNPAYLSLALSAPDIRNEIELTARSTSGVNNINTEEIKALEISLPSLADQNEIVRRVENLFAIADKLEASLTTVRKRVEQLTPAILAQAFRGELVAQDSSDEPASALLARIIAPVAPKRSVKKAA